MMRSTRKDFDQNSALQAACDNLDRACSGVCTSFSIVAQLHATSPHSAGAGAAADIYFALNAELDIWHCR